MLRLLLLLAAQTQALRAPPTRPLRIRHVHRAVTAPTTDAATNRVALPFPVLTVAAAEAAIGLAILVVYFRNRGSIAVEDVNVMKG